MPLFFATALRAAPAAAAAREPDRALEFVVPAGTGGGTDQMVRLIQSIVAKHGLMKQPMVAANKSGGAGADGFLEVKGAKGDPHKIIVTLSKLFTTPLATGVPFNWRDVTPVSMMALDQFVLWVNAESPYGTARDDVDAAKKAGPPKIKMGGTGSKQEDQIITVAPEKALRHQADRRALARRRRRCRAARRQAHRFIRASITRSKPFPSGAPDNCGRCASSIRASPSR